jgi:hypothetical protein
MLANLINTHALADAQGGKWDAVAEILNAQTVEVRNPKSWTMADLITLLGKDEARIVGASIKAAGAVDPLFDGAWMAINGQGLQLHTDERQEMIAGLADAAGWPGGLKAAALAAGLTYTSLTGGTVTAEQCEVPTNRLDYRSSGVRCKTRSSIRRLAIVLIWSQHLRQLLTRWRLHESLHSARSKAHM